MSKRKPLIIVEDKAGAIPRNELLAAYRRIERNVGKPDERPLNRKERRALARQEKRR